MGVKLQSSSGGSVEIAAPVTASNYVLTAPTTSSTIDTLARTGNVLQVVNATCSTQVNSTSSSYVDTGLSATITPSSVNSKVLVLVHHNGVRKSSASQYSDMSVKLLRDSTGIIQFALYSLYTFTALEIRGQTLSTAFLDAPSTTAATTYKTQFANTDALGSVSLQYEGASSASTITLMEIAG